MKLDDAVSLYIRIRERKSELKKKYDEDKKALDDKMATIEAKLLEMFNRTGQEMARTAAGTAYISVRSTASVADHDVFLEFVKEHDEWGLVDVRAAKSAIDAYRAAHENQLPPGISITEERCVNIRRSP
jgi:hypothetical protein